MFIAGNDDQAKHVVSALLRVRLARGRPRRYRERGWLEALSLAWVVYSHRTGKTHHAFKLVGK